MQTHTHTVIAFQRLAIATLFFNYAGRQHGLFVGRGPVKATSDCLQRTNFIRFFRFSSLRFSASVKSRWTHFQMAEPMPFWPAITKNSFFTSAFLLSLVSSFRVHFIFAVRHFTFRGILFLWSQDLSCHIMSPGYPFFHFIRPFLSFPVSTFLFFLASRLKPYTSPPILILCVRFDMAFHLQFLFLVHFRFCTHTHTPSFLGG